VKIILPHQKQHAMKKKTLRQAQGEQEDPIQKLLRVTKARHLDINALLKEYYSADQSGTSKKKAKSPRKKK
jgi:hypothetical protein